MDINNIFTKKTMLTAAALGSAGIGALAYAGKLAPLNAKIQTIMTAAIPHIHALIAETGSLTNAAITNLTPYISSASTVAAEYIAMTGLTPLTLSVGLGVGATALLIIVVLIRKNRALSKQLAESVQLNEEWQSYGANMLNKYTSAVNTIAQKDTHIQEIEAESEENKILKNLKRINQGQIETLQNYYNEKSKELYKERTKCKELQDINNKLMQQLNDQELLTKRYMGTSNRFVDKLLALGERVGDLETTRDI